MAEHRISGVNPELPWRSLAGLYKRPANKYNTQDRESRGVF